MSSRLVKKQLNSLIADDKPDKSVAATRGLKKRTAKRKQSKAKLAKKAVDEQNVEKKLKEAEAKNTVYFAATATVQASTAGLMHNLLGLQAPAAAESDEEDMSQYF